MPDQGKPGDDIILDVHNVHRLFEPTHALKGITFQAKRGEILALIGPNGAGKTTLGEIVSGRDKPDHGTVTFHLDDGETETPDPSEVGWFPGDSSFYMSLAVERLLYHAASKKGLDGNEAAEATQYWLERLGLANRPTTALANLSKGNQQKVQFAESVLHGPSLVYLDEPFNGLDPINQEWFIALIRELQETGMTILISDHHMHLLERIADRILILHQGRLVACGTINELRARAQTGHRIRLRVLNAASVDLTPFKEHRGIRHVERTASGEIRLLTRSEALRTEVLNLAKSKMKITEVLAEPANLHDIYTTVFSIPSADAEESKESTEEPALAAAA
jgi:ABC-2 type transport system ATP-binding protein